MNQALIALLAVASFVLVVDLITTYLRKRARLKSIALEPRPTEEEELGSEPNEGVTIEIE